MSLASGLKELVALEQADGETLQAHIIERVPVQDQRSQGLAAFLLHVLAE